MSLMGRGKQRFFVFIKCKIGQAPEVAKHIIDTRLGLFAEAHSISGDWGLVLRTEFDSDADFGVALAEILDGIDGITASKSLVTCPIWDPEDVFFADSPGSDGVLADTVPRQQVKQRLFIFIACEPGKTYAVGEEFVSRTKKIVRELSSVSEDWDLLALVEIPCGADIGRQISSLFEDFPSIKNTQTVLAYRIA